MNKKLRVVSLLVAVGMLLSGVLTGCGDKNNAGSSATVSEKTTEAAATSAEAEPTIDTSKEVLITGYLLGEAPKGMPEVMAELNTRLKKDINATMKIDYIGWGDMASKYPLILASGSDTDWIFTADWNGYAKHAAKDAFIELKEEQIAKYMPEYYASIDKIAFKKASVGGKNFMIPGPALSPAIPMAMIRGDLRKKYDIPEINRVSDLGPYFEAIKKNEPSIIPAALNGSTDDVLSYQLVAEQGQQFIQLTYGVGVGYFLESDGKLYSYEEEPIASRLKNAAQTMKSWYDAGYINRDYYSNKVASQDSFDQGKSAIGFGNTISLRSSLDAAAAKGFEIELIPFIDTESKVIAPSYTSGGVSLLPNSKNVERTLMAMNLIISDQSYNYLVYYGIEGKNYVLNNGKLGLPEGVTAENNTYPADAAGFWFTDQRQFPPSMTWSDSYIKLLDNIQKNYLYTSILQGFTFNSESVKTELANLANVRAEFFIPLSMGSVKNVDEAYNTYIEKAKVAGLQKVREELEKQVAEFLKNN